MVTFRLLADHIGVTPTDGSVESGIANFVIGSAADCSANVSVLEQVDAAARDGAVLRK
jgi:hypothetical protein